ncbi:hypothetical protein GDO86_004820 [Hymenochirus boettgeri]|uniref:Uncharacterized protein n=1 Tax=Hymenochirus boettgeri TaxID=247094 RepID=A0A8T2K7F3_9PIPI|nr:hypothetical protein GDO86_004820 [Hymenochirus boettgeri]
MPSLDLNDELNCSICLNIYTDPVSLPCGHKYCQGCIEDVLGTQEGSGVYSCPECRAEFVDRPALQRKRKSIRPERNDGTGISCTYCIHSPVPAVKSCLHCEASLCDNHLKVHSKSGKHVLTEPTTSFREQKCSVHDELLTYFCPEDYTCVCVSCCLTGEHRGHQVALLSEAFEKMKVKLRNVLENLPLKREEAERKVQVLQERRREVKGNAAAETERVSALFRDIRERVESLEKRVLGEISRQEEKLSLNGLIQQLEIKKDELSRKIRHIEELCNMTDPLCLLKGLKLDGSAVWDGLEEDYGKKYNKMVSTVKHLDVTGISDTLFKTLDDMVFDTDTDYCKWENRGLVMDKETAGDQVKISNFSKTVSYLKNIPNSSLIKDEYGDYWLKYKFQTHPQVLSKKCFSSGRHHWDLDVCKSSLWGIGVAYGSIERVGDGSLLGNNKSWVLRTKRNNLLSKNENLKYVVIHNGRQTALPNPKQDNSLEKIRIFLDYEAGLLSFYNRGRVVQHLHTFTATFTEPLYAAFWVRAGSVRIIG